MFAHVLYLAGRVLFFHEWIPADWTFGTTEQLLQRVRDAHLKLPPDADEEKLRKEAERAIEEVRKWYANRDKFDKDPKSID